PLAPLAFAVLPQAYRGQALARADDPAFARDPVGSGPFRYASRKTEDERTYAVFLAIPYQRRRARPGVAQVREVRFFVPADPVKDFRHATRPLHLWLDVPTEQTDALRAAGVANVRTLDNRRVTFLAVNHRVPAV